jgi:hypothetical protein
MNKQIANPGAIAKASKPIISKIYNEIIKIS